MRTLAACVSTFKVNVDTSKAALAVEVTRAWASNGADRFYNLVKNGFQDGIDHRMTSVLTGANCRSEDGGPKPTNVVPSTGTPSG